MKKNQNIDIGFLLKKIDEKLSKKQNAELNLDGITFPQLRVLLFVNEQERRSTTQKEIETFLDVSHPTTNGIIKRLEEKDLLTTELTVKNGRMSKTVSITYKGNRICQENEINKDKMEQNFKNWISKKEYESLEKILLKLYKKLNES